MDEHKTFEELTALLTEAATLVTIGAQYVHYKDPASLYEVTGLSIFEAVDEVAVKYRSVAHPEVEFIRPLGNWLAEVMWHGTLVPRFTKQL